MSEVLGFLKVLRKFGKEIRKLRGFRRVLEREKGDFGVERLVL